MYRRNKPTTEDKGTYTTYLFEREALRFINETVERDKNQPFFIYLAYNAPHGAPSQRAAFADSLRRPGAGNSVSMRNGGGLFDLSEEIGEKRDLSDKLPEVKARL